MTETNTVRPGELGKPIIIIGAALTTMLLGGMGFAAVHVPGALSSAGASAPVAPPNGGSEQPAGADPDATPDSSGEQNPGTQDDTTDSTDDSVDDSDEGQTEDDSVSESDDHPDRDSDRTEDTEAREPESEYFDSDVVYTIVSGDTLVSISAETGVSVDMLAEYNSIRNVNVIYEDSSLVIPYSEVNVSLTFAEH